MLFANNVTKLLTFFAMFMLLSFNTVSLSLSLSLHKSGKSWTGSFMIPRAATTPQSFNQLRYRG